jgi:hypothetical protein
LGGGEVEVALPGTIEEAIVQLRRDPTRSVRAEVDGLTVELRRVDAEPEAGELAADVFREIGPWEGESYEEIRAILTEARREGARRSVPDL